MLTDLLDVKHLTIYQTNSIIVHGALCSSGRPIESPPYLRACMRGSPHLSRRFIEEDAAVDDIEENRMQVPDPRSDALGDEWYTALTSRNHIPKMNALLDSWSRRHLMVCLFIITFDHGS